MSEEKVSLSNQVPQPQPGEQLYTPPTATVPLPSQGKVYAQNSALYAKEILEIRAMTARDEDILTSRALLKSGRAIDTLLKSCIHDKNIDVDSMLSGDRNAALVAIRITGYGQGYNISVTCPKCEEKFEHEFDLSKLEIKQLQVEPRAPGVNEFTFTLPVSRKTVIFKLPTGADERDLSLTIDRMRKASGGLESLVTTRLLSQIVSIDDEQDKSKLAQFIRNMPARDSRDLRSYMDKISPGINMKQLVVCESCNEESEVDVPMGTEFFWPES